MLPSTLLLFLLFPFCRSVGTIGPNQYVKDGDTIVSKEIKFELGFFSPGNSSYRYVGIWYAKVPQKPVVWVANREKPITDSSGVLKINRNGSLVLFADNKENLVIWSTKISGKTNSSSTSVQLLDTGNLVLVQGENSEDVLWQSFDYPTDTMLPGMKLGLNREVQLNSFLTSWKSQDDPGTGDFSYRLNTTGSPEFFLYNGSTRYWRSGPWPWRNISVSTSHSNPFIFVNNQVETYIIDSAHNTSELSRYVVNYHGTLQRLKWNDIESQWKEIWAAPKYPCDQYGECGAFSTCTPDNIQGLKCTCLPGYEPRSFEDWYQGDGSDGCVSKQPQVSKCENGGFKVVQNVKLPDASISAWLDTKMSDAACKHACLRNCSCLAYSSLEIEGGSGCLAWYGELMDILLFAEEGSDFYVRVDSSELAAGKSRGFLRRKGTLAVLILPILVALYLIMFAYRWLMKKRKRTGMRVSSPMRRTWWRQYSHFSHYTESMEENKLEDTTNHPDLQLFHLSTIIAATEDFSLANKLGEGGFGSVFKGQLSNQHMIAVKRLSMSSRQGIEEFKTEVTLIAKLQHRNLVKLLGCCIEKEEKMLIYEYLPNNSLDSFLFDQTRRSILDWRKRCDIVIGVARGILYLHQDSRLRIIHRDLKTSNVLLDAEMKPKVSDFGMARIFNGDQQQHETNRVVGTYGYMSPEYAVYGKFSTKSDVFSFGVILLEIVSGKKNNASYQEDHSRNLIGHVWDLWTEQRALDIVDSSLKSYHIDEVLRCIQIALLCLQKDAADRPAMSEVVLMLSGERALASPQQPAFIFKCNNADPLIEEGSYSTNYLTMTCKESDQP